MRFKQWLLNEEDNIHTIYCDMDGVLTDLVGKLAELSGQQFSSNGEAMRALVRMRKNNPEAIESPFWASLNWTPNGKKVWEKRLRSRKRKTRMGGKRIRAPTQ
jgi:hypothetical protein